jgi:hypothetical protein
MMYEAQPQRSFKTCLKYMTMIPLL